MPGNTVMWCCMVRYVGLTHEHRAKLFAIISHLAFCTSLLGGLLDIQKRCHILNFVPHLNFLIQKHNKRGPLGENYNIYFSREPSIMMLSNRLWSKSLSVVTHIFSIVSPLGAWYSKFVL